MKIKIPTEGMPEKWDRPEPELKPQSYKDPTKLEDCLYFLSEDVDCSDIFGDEDCDKLGCLINKYSDETGHHICYKTCRPENTAAFEAWTKMKLEIPTEIYFAEFDGYEFCKDKDGECQHYNENICYCRLFKADLDKKYHAPLRLGVCKKGSADIKPEPVKPLIPSEFDRLFEIVIESIYRMKEIKDEITPPVVKYPALETPQTTAAERLNK